MNARAFGGRTLTILGVVAMVIGAVDPLEGSVLIVPGSGMVALGTALLNAPRRSVRYWISVFILMTFGVAAMFILSSFGGIGGKHGQSPWWAIVLVPYPVAIIMALAGGVVALIRAIRRYAGRRKTGTQEPLAGV